MNISKFAIYHMIVNTVISIPYLPHCKTKILNFWNITAAVPDPKSTNISSGLHNVALQSYVCASDNLMSWKSCWWGTAATIFHKLSILPYKQYGRWSGDDVQSCNIQPRAHSTLKFTNINWYVYSIYCNLPTIAHNITGVCYKL